MSRRLSTDPVDEAAVSTPGAVEMKRSSAASRLNAFRSRCTIECRLSPNLAGLMAASQPVMASALIFGGAPALYGGEVRI